VRRRHWAALAVIPVVLVGAALDPAPALGQQEDEVIGDVAISFDVGELDAAEGDWLIDSVTVSGDLEEGAPFTLELRGADDALLWTATQPYEAPTTRIEVTEAVAVGEVLTAGVSQGQTIVGGVQVEPPAVDWSSSGGGGSGQLALSMVMTVIIVAIVFRSPLPSASTERWTK
jgi:hypothetical protein